ncbi:MAG: zinc ribbon domain-containing protein [Candidatus Lokiarchaeota archaeon]|nr:zinc ribbon domain-containing protein [Candidatus Lokiarchaeota archaeon]
MLFGFFKKKEKSAPGFKCTKCGAENPMDAKFCLSCGAGLAEQRAVQSKVAEATEVTETFKDKGGFWQKIIPGYHGYKQKEMRRESDKLLRDQLVKMLQSAKKDLIAIQEDAASSGSDLVQKLEDTLTEFDTFIKKVQHANYGMGGLFDTVKVKEQELDKLIDFDKSIMETVMSLQTAMKELAGGVDADKIKQLRSFIKDAQGFYAQRDGFILGWKPT